MKYWAELSGDNVELARRELAASLRVVYPAGTPPREVPWGLRMVAFESPQVTDLAPRLALTHRLLRPLSEGPVEVLRRAMKEEGGSGRSIALRTSSGSGRVAGLVPTLGRAYVEGGGRVDLTSPERTLVLLPSRENPMEFAVAEEVGVTERLRLARRPPKTLAFRKPVTLSPLLARALVNLSEVPPGGTLIDPFCGTGAILIEGAAVGCRIVGADVDSRMVRGALANLASFGVVPERMVQCDVGDLPRSLDDLPRINGGATDPPYGRASTTKGEEAGRLLLRALESLGEIVERGSRVAIMVPSPQMMARLPSGWGVVGEPIPLPVHRSLTRWVFVLRN